jgi:hypothetical protein
MKMIFYLTLILVINQTICPGKSDPTINDCAGAIQAFRSGFFKSIST